MIENKKPYEVSIELAAAVTIIASILFIIVIAGIPTMSPAQNTTYYSTGLAGSALSTANNAYSAYNVLPVFVGAVIWIVFMASLYYCGRFWARVFKGAIGLIIVCIVLFILWAVVKPLFEVTGEVALHLEWYHWLGLGFALLTCYGAGIVTERLQKKVGL